MGAETISCFVIVFAVEKVIKSGIEPDWTLELRWMCNFSNRVWSCGNQLTVVKFVKSILTWCFDVSWWNYKRL